MSVEPRILLPSQKKRVLEICQQHAVQPYEFVWEETRIGSATAPLVSLLKHNLTKYFFLFDFYPTGTHKNVYSPAEHSLRFEQDHSSWDTTFQNVENWATYLAREIHATSFLERAREIPTLENVTQLDVEDSPFNLQEQSDIAEKLDLIEARILESTSKVDANASYVAKQFDKMEKMSKSMGRISWLQLFIGALVSMLSAFVDADTARGIWKFANEQVHSIFSNLPRLKG